MPRDDGDLITFHDGMEGWRRCLRDNTLTELASHLMYSIFVAIEFLGDLVVRQVEAHKRGAQYPHTKRLMTPGKDGAG